MLQTAVAMPLPAGNDNLPPSVTRRPKLWPFPSALQAWISRDVALEPRFTIQIGSANTQGGAVTGAAAQSFAFGTLINVSVRRYTTAASAAAATTYELVGADQTGVNLLENLLDAMNATPGMIDGIYIVYPPNQSSSRAAGVQYDGQQNYTTFLVQANLSTETNPPTQLSMVRLGGSPVPRGLLDDFTTFVGRLWSGSIVRSGGYYFVYELEPGVGLPSAVFNDHGVGTIEVLITYKALDGIAGAQGGALKSFMNIALVDDPLTPPTTSSSCSRRRGPPR